MGHYAHWNCDNDVRLYFSVRVFRFPRKTYHTRKSESFCFRMCPVTTPTQLQETNAEWRWFAPELHHTFWQNKPRRQFASSSSLQLKRNERARANQLIFAQQKKKKKTFLGKNREIACMKCAEILTSNFRKQLLVERHDNFTIFAKISWPQFSGDYTHNTVIYSHTYLAIGFVHTDIGDFWPRATFVKFSVTLIACHWNI